MKIKDISTEDRKKKLTLQSVTEADRDASLPEDLQAEKHSMSRVLGDSDIWLPEAQIKWFFVRSMSIGFTISKLHIS